MRREDGLFGKLCPHIWVDLPNSSLNIDMKNNVSTQGYFIKRLRDSGFATIKLFDKYAQYDPRKWSIMVDPSNTSVIITCYQNRECVGDVMFEFNDGGNRFIKNFNLKTQSMEIVITTLIEKGVEQMYSNSNYIKYSHDQEE